MRIKKEGNEFYEIKANYQICGMNWFTNKEESRGIYISFGVVEVGEHFVRSVPFASNSFKILYKELKRKSAKQIKEAEDFIERNQDEILNMYKANDKAGLIDFIYRKGD